MYQLAMDLGMTRQQVGRLPSQEVTAWIAYYQVRDWMRKAEAETPEQALAFARAVHDIFAERYERTGTTQYTGE